MIKAVILIKDMPLKVALREVTWGGIERGQRNIALLNICKLADTLGIEPSELLKFR